ncbi:MAG: hypothetical protein ACSW8G_05060, partial [Bacillota bacterium]
MKEREKKKSGWLKTLILLVLAFIGAVLLCVFGLFAYLTVTEYNPEDIETVEVTEGGSGGLQKDESFKVMS